MAGVSREVVKWLQSLDLTWQVKTPKWDLTNGYLVAEICSWYYPRDIEMHMYNNGRSLECKQKNWNLLKIFFKRNKFEIPPDFIEGTIHCKENGAMLLIERIYEILTNRQVRKQPPQVEAPDYTDRKYQEKLAYHARSTASLAVKNNIKITELMAEPDIIIGQQKAQTIISDHLEYRRQDRDEQPLRFDRKPTIGELAPRVAPAYREDTEVSQGGEAAGFSSQPHTSDKKNKQGYIGIKTGVGVQSTIRAKRKTSRKRSSSRSEKNCKCQDGYLGECCIMAECENHPGSGRVCAQGSRLADNQAKPKTTGKSPTESTGKTRRRSSSRSRRNSNCDSCTCQDVYCGACFIMCECHTHPQIDSVCDQGKIKVKSPRRIKAKLTEQPNPQSGDCSEACETKTCESSKCGDVNSGKCVILCECQIQPGVESVCDPGNVCNETPAELQAECTTQPVSRSGDCSVTCETKTCCESSKCGDVIMCECQIQPGVQSVCDQVVNRPAYLGRTVQPMSQSGDCSGTCETKPCCESCKCGDVNSGKCVIMCECQLQPGAESMCDQADIQPGYKSNLSRKCEDPTSKKCYRGPHTRSRQNGQGNDCDVMAKCVDNNIGTCVILCECVMSPRNENKSNAGTISHGGREHTVHFKEVHVKQLDQHGKPFSHPPITSY